jgi:hypothetical protein
VVPRSTVWESLRGVDLGTEKYLQGRATFVRRVIRGTAQFRTGTPDPVRRTLSHPVGDCACVELASVKPKPASAVASRGFTLATPTKRGSEIGCGAGFGQRRRAVGSRTRSGVVCRGLNAGGDNPWVNHGSRYAQGSGATFLLRRAFGLSRAAAAAASTAWRAQSCKVSASSRSSGGHRHREPIVCVPPCLVP